MILKFFFSARLLCILRAGDLQVRRRSHHATNPSCPTEQRIDGPKDPKLRVSPFLLLCALVGWTNSRSTIRFECALNRLTICRVSGSKWHKSLYEVAAAKYSPPEDILRLRMTSVGVSCDLGRLSWAIAKVVTQAILQQGDKLKNLLLLYY